jgi:hypothetical protein
MLAVTVVCILTAISTTIWRELTDPLRFNKRFHRVIRSADRLAVIGLDFDSSDSDEPIEKTLFEITDSKELAEVFEHLQLAPNGSTEPCMCGGYPGLNWYRGETPLALTTVSEDHALDWDGNSGPVLFTDDSARWLLAWLGKHGVDISEEANQAKSDERAARKLLGGYIPAGFAETLRRAESAETPGTDAEKELSDKCVRSLFRDNAMLYSTLFKILGCIPMRWDCWYEPEQGEAFEFLTRAPREELDTAIRSAARSKIPEERKGAARIVFSQYFMTQYGKTESDVSTWMTLLADVAYTDKLPENRRLVLNRLLEYRGAKAFGVLELAVADPDQTVRRKAIRLLAVDGTAKAVQLLRRMAAGDIRPRTGKKLSMNYSAGTKNSLNSSEMREEDLSDMDREAAEKAIRETVR